MKVDTEFIQGDSSMFQHAPDPIRHLHILHALIRDCQNSTVRLLVFPHEKWKTPAGKPYWTLPTKKTLALSGNPLPMGQTVEPFVDALMTEDLGLKRDDYLLDQELEPVVETLDSMTRPGKTRYDIYPADVWVAPGPRASLASFVKGAWLTPDEILAARDMSPTAVSTINALLKRETALQTIYTADPQAEFKPEARRRLLRGVADSPSTEMLALRWHADNNGGVRCMPFDQMSSILASSTHAFNTLVADPYLRYHNQGFGLTFSFFTQKDPQDLHLHGMPIYEFYGVLSGGPLEIFWKPKHARGASAWCRRVIEPLGYAEIGPEMCHIVRWLSPGIGVVFKAGPGPLAGVGRQGVAGKTPCQDCQCCKTIELCELIRDGARK
jgi:hypothetical protein